ncbi:hypothetical protein Tco_1516781 [Tanacetum coccineum]
MVDLDRITSKQFMYICQELGVWRKSGGRAGADDKPLRMVKTVLHELVKLRGTAIIDAQLKVDIFSQLQNASEAFRTYIRDCLAQMEKNATAGRTPYSVPMPTPPPSAVNLPSPKYTPLSPVVSSYAEDDRSVNVMAARGPIPVRSNYGYHQEEKEDHRNDRSVSLQDEVQFLFIGNSGIDAIREDEKHPVVGNPEPVNRPMV